MANPVRRLLRDEGDTGSIMDAPGLRERDRSGDDDPGVLVADILAALEAQAENCEGAKRSVALGQDTGQLTEAAEAARALAELAENWDHAEVLAAAEINHRFWLRSNEANAAEDMAAFLRSLGARVARDESGTTAPVDAPPATRPADARHPVLLLSDLAEVFPKKRTRRTKDGFGVRFDFTSTVEWATVLLWDDQDPAVFLPEGVSRPLVEICGGYVYPPRFGRPGPEHETKGFLHSLSGDGNAG